MVNTQLEIFKRKELLKQHIGIHTKNMHYKYKLPEDSELEEVRLDYPYDLLLFQENF